MQLRNPMQRAFATSKECAWSTKNAMPAHASINQPRRCIKATSPWSRQLGPQHGTKIIMISSVRKRTLGQAYGLCTDREATQGSTPIACKASLAQAFPPTCVLLRSHGIPLPGILHRPTKLAMVAVKAIGAILAAATCPEPGAGKGAGVRMPHRANTRRGLHVGTRSALLVISACSLSWRFITCNQCVGGGHCNIHALVYSGCDGTSNF